MSGINHGGLIMKKARSRLWLPSLLFVLLAVALGITYQKYRAGDIQTAEGRREDDAGRFDLAESSFHRATQLEPTNADAFYWLGMSRKNRGDSAGAAEALAKATSLKPERISWWVEYAESLQWAERFADAERAWERVRGLLPPGDVRVRMVRVNIARNIGAQGQIDRAVEMLNKMLAEKDDRQVRFMLAEVLAWGGRFKESAEEYRRAFDSKPEK
jgi:tetratricopeptide (TPR) repeat protein